MSSGGIQIPRVVVGDQAQEMEIKDASGRYRHARRAPVDENTLQPSRRPGWRVQYLGVYK